MKKNIVFITGSSRGIGLGLAKSFKERDFIVIINGSNEKRLKIAAKKNNINYFYSGDITQVNICRNIIKKIKKKFGKIDLLISNYGESNFKKNNLEFEASFKKNFFSATNFILESQKLIKKGGSIVCISSICGVKPIEKAPIAYSCAKASLNFFVKLFSKELANYQISLNSISPGNVLFDGSLWDKKLKQNKYQTLKYIKKNVPIAKFGSINDIFQICLMIHENETGFLTGANFVVDGGQTNI